MAILAKAELSGEAAFTLRLLNGDGYEAIVIGDASDD